ncbi:MAG: hypothetical protein HY824_05720 [Acidobacteria bacterium]|nr:hypothetical protein [Acidobacteriota bacterium]
MLALLIGAVLAVQPACSRDASVRLDRAAARAAAFDVKGAVAQLEAAADGPCEPVAVARVYGRGLLDANDAFLQGGSTESLAPVRAAIAALDALAAGRPGPADIARLVLRAAAAAAQSERDEMRLYLDSAVQLESLQQAAGQSGAPLVSAAEIAGDLWLQLHRYDDARRAYADAAGRLGSTLRLLSGTARAARRLMDATAACGAYRRLLEAWGARAEVPEEIAEARVYAAGCSSPSR